MPREPLSYEKRGDIDQALVDRLLDLGIMPFRPASMSLDDAKAANGPQSTAAFSLDLARRLMFPSVAYSTAGRRAKQFEEWLSDAKIAPQKLRHFVLRTSGEIVPPDQLRDQLDAFSRANAQCFDYLSKKLSGGPLLTVMHVRWDAVNAGFDLHAHVIWYAPSNEIDQVVTYLSKRFAQFWLDPDAVRLARALVYYLVRNIFPHSDLASWPDEAIVSAWERTKRYKFHRPAGAYLKSSSSSEVDDEEDEPAVTDEASSYSTVRTITPESSINPNAFMKKVDSVTIFQLIVVASLMRFKRRVEDGEARRFDPAPFSKAEVLFHVAAVEKEFDAVLFDRTTWRLTSAGRTLEKRFSPLLDLSARANRIRFADEDDVESIWHRS